MVVWDLFNPTVLSMSRYYAIRFVRQPGDMVRAIALARELMQDAKLPDFLVFAHNDLLTPPTYPLAHLPTHSLTHSLTSPNVTLALGGQEE
jgi:hypothetical protein